MRKLFFYVLPIVLMSCYSTQVKNQSVSKDSYDSDTYILSEINGLRKNGCLCNGKYYSPVQVLKWNALLYKSAYKHAKSMYDFDYFSHISPDGKDVGDRLETVGYNWQYAGENLAEGQKSFKEAMHDWIASESHCKMLMNPNMEEVGVAKYGNYWVQHFGKQMPVNGKRVNRKYSEGG